MHVGLANVANLGEFREQRAREVLGALEGGILPHEIQALGDFLLEALADGLKPSEGDGGHIVLGQGLVLKIPREEQMHQFGRQPID